METYYTDMPDPRVVWVTATHRYKKNWLHSRGFHLNYSKIPDYWNLPHYVRDRWESELKEQ